MFRRREQRSGGLFGRRRPDGGVAGELGLEHRPLGQGARLPGQQGSGLAPARIAVAERMGTRFTMKQRLFAFGDDFWITNEHGQKVIKVDGKLFRLRDTLSFEDAHGRELYHITARIIDIRETMDIKRPNGQVAAVVHNAWFSPIRDRWQIAIPGEQAMTAAGGILQHEYTIHQGGRIPVAVVSKKWLRLRDTYGVEVENAFDAPLILAITVVIDMMSHKATTNTDDGLSKGSGLDLL
jgi:uncharacterized protein YxjI